MLAQIVAMVAAAQRSRAPIQRLADRVSAWFVPAVVAVAVIAFAAWAALGPEPRFAYGLVAAVSVLIIACPCALGLATPMSIMVGVGRGAQAGVLIRNAEALERMERVDTLVVDKTGTLTEGKPKVTGVVTAPGFDEADVLRLAASVERASEHPLGAAIVAAAAERGTGARAGGRLRRARRQGRDRRGRRPPRRGRQRAVPEQSGHRDRDVRRARRGGTARGRDGDLRGNRRQGRRPPGDRRPDQGRDSRCAARRCARRACASSCSPATTGPPPRRWRAGSQ